MNTAKTLLEGAVKVTREEAFLPAYQDELSDELALGVAVAKFCEWDGERIVETFAAALEDANYHKPRADMLAYFNRELGTHFA